MTVRSPGGLNQDESLRMVQSAQYYPRLVASLSCGLRYLPAYRKMRSALSSGLVGPSPSLVDVRLSMRPLVGRSYDWLCDSAMGGGLLNLLGGHVVDLVHFLTGRRALRAHGTLRTLTESTATIGGIRRISADDLAVFQLEMEGGCLATATLNCQLGGFSQEVTVCGAEGHLVARNGDLYARKGGSGSEQLLFKDEEEEEGTTNNPDDDEDPLFSGIYLRGLVNMYKELSERFRAEEEEEGGQEQPGRQFSLFENAQYVQAVIEAVRASARTRAWTKVTTKEQLPENNSFSSSSPYKFH